MGKSFTRALKHLKSNHKTTKLDEKKEMLNEIPTMHTGGVYSKNPPGFRYDPPARAKRFLPDVDGNWPAGIPGTPGANEYIRPQGYWVNDSDWEEKFEANMSNDSILQDPTNTDGFIDAQSGTVKTQLPPNSRSFILGPLVDGYNWNHGYDDFTRIGYIQKDTRQFVLLATIQGHWDTTRDTGQVINNGKANREWDGTSSQFTAYNENFTLEMAQWFKDKLSANNFTKNFPYFYSGGIFQGPLPNQPPGSPGNMNGGNAPGTGGGGNDPDDAGGFGSGGEPDTGTEQPQDDPEGGDAESQGYPWGMDPEELDRMSDDDLAENDPPLIRDPETGDIREMTEDEKNQHDAEVLGLSPDEWAKIAEVFDASMLVLDVAAVLGVIFPELGTSIAGGFQLARRARQIRRAWQIWSNRNKGGPSNKPKPPKPKTPKPDPNPNGDVPNSDRRGKDFNVDKDTGIVRDDKGTPTFEPTFDKDGNIKSYKPVDPRNINRGRSNPSSGGDNPNTGHPEFNPGGKYNTRPPIKPKGGNTGGSGGSQPPRGGGNIGGGGGTQPPRGGGGRPPRGGGGRPPRGGSSQPKFTGFDGKPLDQVDPSTIRRPDGKPFDPLPPKGGDSGKNTGKPPKGGFREWWNKGRNERIKNENEAPFGDIGDYFRKDSDVNPNTLFGDDALQRGKSDANFKKGKQGNILGRPDQAFNPFRPAEKGGPTSGPTPAVRQAVERPLRKLKGGFGGAAKRAGGTDNLIGKQLTQQQQKDIVRKTRVLEDRVVNNLKSEKEIDGFISKTEKAAEFIQKNEEASNVLDTAIKGARTAREVADQIGQYANTMKVAGTAFGKFLAHNAGVMKATPENPVKINLPKQDAQNVSNTINKYLKDNKVPVAQWSNLPQKHLDGINSLVASGQQTNRSTINNKFRGEGGILRDEYHNTVNNIGRKDAFANHIRIDSKGIPYVSGIDDNYTFTDPQDALGGIPAKLVEITNKSPFTRNREDSPYTYKNSDGTSVSIGNMPSRWNLPAPTGAIVKSSPRARTRGSGFDNQKEPLPTGAIVPKTSGARALRNNYEPRGTLLREDKKRILREITKPLTEIKELPKTQKLEKYRPNFAGKYKPQNTPNVTASEKSDEMVKAKNAAGQTWRTKDKYWGGYQSQERMNVVYDNVGHGDQYFDRIVNENLHKKNLKNRQVQEHLNIIAHEKAMRQLDSSFVSPFRNIEEQETYDNKVKDPLFSKVADRLNKEINYEKKPAKKGYPDKPPVQLDPNTGMHPKYGKRYKYDKLDPQSAEAMPVQGNPEIDANVQKALDKRAKDRKIKNLTVNTTNEKVDWRETLQKRNVGESKKNFKNLRKDLQEQLYTNITTGMKVGQTFRYNPTGATFTTGGVLGGREMWPPVVTFSDDGFPVTIDGPSESEYGIQGYAKLLNMMRRKNSEDLEDINARLDASQEFARKVNSDVMMNARVGLQPGRSASPESTEAARQQSINYIKQVIPKTSLSATGSYVPPVADSERNYGLTKDKIEIKDFVDALDKKSIITKEYGNKYTTLQKKMDEVGRGTPAATSIEKEIANLIDAEVAELDAVDQELDAVEKEKETPPPPPEDEYPSDESPSDESPFDDAEARASYEKARKDNPDLPPWDDLSSGLELPDIPKEGWTYLEYMAMQDALSDAAAAMADPIEKEIMRYSPTGFEGVFKTYEDEHGQRNTPLGLIEARAVINDALTRAQAALAAKWKAYNDAMLPPEGGGGEGTPTGGEDGFDDGNPEDPNEPVPDPDDENEEDDEKFLNKQQTLVNLTKGLNQIGLPNDFAQWTINYAKGDMTPINKFSRGMERQVRDLVLDKFNKNPNAKTVNIDYNDYGYGFKALPTRLGMGRFTATKLDNGKIRIQDTFNVNKDFTNIGSASIVPGLQKTADRLVDISYKNRNIQGREDKGGITIDVVIPGASAVKKYDKNRKRKVNESNTFSKVKKFKNKY